jgi:hypothetical protein
MVVVLVLLTAGCSSGKKKVAHQPKPLAPVSSYEQAAVSDGATALWSLRDANGLSAKDEVADLTGGTSAGTVIGGTIAQTTGPTGQPAAQFLRSGRIVTPVTSGLASTDAFTVELDLRADACVSAWGRVLGTTSLPRSGREGFELLHFPKQFAVSPCRFGVEFWHLNHYVGGCHPKTAPVADVWTHWSVVYAAGHVTCYQDGIRFETNRLVAPGLFRQLGPLGIGGSGSGFQGPLDGASISEVALYGRALGPADVLRHARLAHQAPAPSPTAS